MKKFLSIIALIALGATALTGCLRKDHDTPPDQSQYDPGLEVTHTIAELLAMNNEYNPTNGDDTMLVTEDWVISGIVTANDQSGNFYKRIVIQDSTAGLQILMDAYSLYTQFPVGRKVYVKLKGLYLGFDGGTPVLGASVSPQRGINNIMGNAMGEHIIKANIGNPVPVDTVDLSTIKTYKAQYVNRLIVIREAEFKVYDGLTYSDPLSTTNRTVESCGGDTIVVRTSNYADFATQNLPSRRGTIAGIYTVFQSGSSTNPRRTPQLLIRDTSDVKFNKVRCGEVEGTILFFENFESLPETNISANGWLNISEQGTVKYTVEKYNNNKYAKVTAFMTGQPNVNSWLITRPLDLTTLTNPRLVFKNLDAHNNGATLEVLISTNYNGSSNPSAATWTPLPAQISSGHPTSFGTFITSGEIDLNAYIGAQVYIAFRYIGGDPGKTTTYEIDDVTVYGD